MFKKKIALIIVACMLLISMAACGTRQRNNVGDTVSSVVSIKANDDETVDAVDDDGDDEKDDTVTDSDKPKNEQSTNTKNEASKKDEKKETKKQTTTSTPNITQIEYSPECSMFLDSKGNVYYAGIDVLDKDEIYYSATCIFKGAVDVSVAQGGYADGNGAFNLNLILNKSGVCYAKGFAPNGLEYPEYSKVMKNVKDVAPGLFLKKDDGLYICGKYDDPNDSSKSLDSIDIEDPKLLLENVKDFKGSFEHGMALTNSGDVYIWGEFAIDGMVYNYGFEPIMISSGVKKLGDAEGIFWFIDDLDTLYEVPNDHKDGKFIKIAENAEDYCTTSIYLGTDDVLYKLEQGSSMIIAEDVKQAFVDGKIYYITNSGEFCSATENNGYYFDQQESPYETTICFKGAEEIMSYNGPVFVRTKSKDIYTWGSNEMYSMGIGKHKPVGGDMGSAKNPKKVLFK